MHRTLGRRQFLGWGATGAAALVAGPALLSACGSDAGDAGASSTGSAPLTGDGRFGTIGYQLSWLKTAQFASTYVAIDKGYYAREGFKKVDLVAGGPNVTAEPALASGKAFAAMSSALGATIFEMSGGMPLTLIGSQSQGSTLGIVSLADDPIATPADLAGKTIGAQPVYDMSWDLIMTTIGADPSEIKRVPVQNDPAPLINGEVDGFVALLTNEVVTLQQKGMETVFLNWGDYGFDSIVDAYAVPTQVLEEERDKVKAFLTAEILGAQDNIADPELGARLTVQEHGANLGLDEATALAQNEAQIQASQSPVTAQKGLFQMTPERIQASIDAGGAFGLTISPDMFDNSLLDEIYAGGSTIG